MKKLITTLVLLCAVQSAGLAQTAAPAPRALPAPAVVNPFANWPDVLLKGFESYVKSGYNEAVDVWSKDSALDMNNPVKTAINKTLSDASNMAGVFIAPEPIKTVTLSPSSQLIYVFAKYKKGAMYFCFACYKGAAPDNKWLITSITADLDPAKVLPPDILSGQ